MLSLLEKSDIEIAPEAETGDVEEGNSPAHLDLEVTHLPVDLHQSLAILDRDLDQVDQMTLRTPTEK